MVFTDARYEALHYLCSAMPDIDWSHDAIKRFAQEEYGNELGLYGTNDKQVKRRHRMMKHIKEDFFIQHGNLPNFPYT